jgi:hypothetical protein
MNAGDRASINTIGNALAGVGQNRVWHGVFLKRLLSLGWSVRSHRTDP